MRLIKNFFHNINDVVLAILIVAIAAGVIYWRMQIILDYPKTIVSNQAVTEEPAAEEPVTEEPAAEQPAAADPAAEQPAEQPAEGTEAPQEGGGEAPAEDAAQ